MSSNKLLHLDDYSVTKVHVESLAPSNALGSEPTSPVIAYKVLRNPDNHRQFMLFLSVRLEPWKQSLCLMDCEMAGIFSFGEDANEEQMQYLVRVNGATILYGLLRGFLASMTGAFPGNKTILPSLYMDDVVLEIEKRHQLAQEASKSEHTEKGAPPNSQVPPNPRKEPAHKRHVKKRL